MRNSEGISAPTQARPAKTALAHHDVLAVEDGHRQLRREHHEVLDDVLDEVADDVAHVHVAGADAHHLQLAQRELEVDEGLLHEGQQYNPEARELCVVPSTAVSSTGPSTEAAEGASRS